jgi:hypothetical protein
MLIRVKFNFQEYFLIYGVLSNPTKNDPSPKIPRCSTSWGFFIFKPFHITKAIKNGAPDLYKNLCL